MLLRTKLHGKTCHPRIFTNKRMSAPVFAHSWFYSWMVSANVRAGLKPPAQCMEALRARATESASADFHELRQGFIPPLLTSVPRSWTDASSR